MTKYLVFGVALAMLLWSGSSVHADDGANGANGPSKQDLAQARTLYQQATKDTRRADRLLNRGRRDAAVEAYGEAVGKYLQVFRLSQKTTTLFVLGQVYRQRGDAAWALVCYRTFVEREPESPYVAKANAYIGELHQTVGDTEVTPSESPLDPVGVCYEKPPEPEPEPEPVAPSEPPAEPIALPVIEPVESRSGSGYRTAFWVSAGVTLGTVVGATIGGLQVTGSLEDKKVDAAIAYMNATGIQLDTNDGCGDARSRASARDPLLQAFIDACDRGESRATLTNALWGVSLLGAALSGFFYYKGYLAPGSAKRSSDQARMFRPTIGRDAVGATIQLAF